MDIRNRRELKQAAASALGAVPGEKRIIAVYAGVGAALALVATLLELWLGTLVEAASGLAAMGSRAIWQTAQNVLPLLQSLLLICWSFGYRRVLMEIRSGRAVTPRNLTDTFSFLWPILRLTLLQYLILLGLGLACVYLGTMLFLVTPFSNTLVAQLQSLTDQSSILSGDIALSAQLLEAVYDAYIPLTCVILAVCLPVLVPVLYSMRMAPYILLETPQIYARYAIAGSRRMLHRNRWALFRLDLSFWWYYLLSVLAALVGYADLLLPLVGITLPLGSMAGSLLCYLISLLAQFGISYAFQNQVEMTYVQAYEALKPKPQSGGVVLGNIFQM